MFPIWLYCLIFGGVPEHKALSIFTSGYFTYNTLYGLQIYKAKNTIKSNLGTSNDEKIARISTLLFGDDEHGHIHDTTASMIEMFKAVSNFLTSFFHKFF